MVLPTGAASKAKNQAAEIKRYAIFFIMNVYCAQSSCVNFAEHLLRPSALLDLVNIVQVGLDLRNALDRKICCQNSHHLTGSSIIEISYLTCFVKSINCILLGETIEPMGFC